MFRKRPPQEALPEGWRDTVAARISHWRYLDDTERERLGDLTGLLVDRKNWEAAQGFELDDEMQLVIAAQAALLVLGLTFEHYREVGAIIVHPTTVVLHGERGAPVQGLMTDAPMPILGQAAQKGPILIAWDAVASDARHPERGHNVVFHEFAHKLDMADGAANGVPRMPNREAYRRWEATMGAALTDLRSGRPRFIDSYGANGPGELFAVVTEAFFDVPKDLKRLEPEIYALLRTFYRQDPANR
jgi:Mlc titration factor MtfA (ptsG expression regulator)